MGGKVFRVVGVLDDWNPKTRFIDVSAYGPLERCRPWSRCVRNELGLPRSLGTGEAASLLEGRTLSFSMNPMRSIEIHPACLTDFLFLAI